MIEKDWVQFEALLLPAGSELREVLHHFFGAIGLQRQLSLIYSTLSKLQAKLWLKYNNSVSLVSGNSQGLFPHPALLSFIAL